MQGRFGVREICDVTFKALSEMTVGNKTFKAGQPVFSIETAQTSNMEQATTTVYAQGGKGYNRLISWEGEKTLTFTVTDALMSPMGMKVLTGAGLIEATKEDLAHVHVTYDVTMSGGEGSITCEELCNELGLTYKADTQVYVCNSVDAYGSVLNSGGSVVDWLENPVKMSSEGTVASDIFVKDAGEILAVEKDNPLKLELQAPDKNNFSDKVIKVDFYVLMPTGVQTIQIEPSSFGGYFYVEADTLFRDEATGKDLAASLIFPKVKVQSAFTFTMAASGDPSTFDFVMDAFPAYTRFNKSKKTLVDMQIITGSDASSSELLHKHDEDPAVKYTAASHTAAGQLSV